MATALGLLFGIALIVIVAVADMQWLTGTVLLLCLVGWLVLEIRERGSEGRLTALGVLLGIAMIVVAFVADVAWLTGTVLVLVLIGWLTVMIRDRRTT